MSFVHISSTFFFKVKRNSQNFCPGETYSYVVVMSHISYSQYYIHSLAKLPVLLQLKIYAKWKYYNRLEEDEAWPLLCKLFAAIPRQCHWLLGAKQIFAHCNLAFLQPWQWCLELWWHFTNIRWKWMEVQTPWVSPFDATSATIRNDPVCSCSVLQNIPKFNGCFLILWGDWRWGGGGTGRSREMGVTWNWLEPPGGAVLLVLKYFSTVTVSLNL